MTRKQTIIDALYKFVHQRPGLEYGNYGDPVSYRAEVRSIGKDLQQARTLLRSVELRDSITAEDLLNAAKHAYSGRLTITETDGKVAIDYCVGQYWPTEYRRAVCAVLASAMWSWWRDHCMPESEPAGLYNGMTKGTYLRHTAKREFGRGIASRWFS